MHHYGTGAWLADVAMRGVICGVIYDVIERLMRALTMPEVVLLCCILLVVFIAYRSRRR